MQQITTEAYFNLHLRLLESMAPSVTVKKSFTILMPVRQRSCPRRRREHQDPDDRKTEWQQWPQRPQRRSVWPSEDGQPDGGLRGGGGGNRTQNA